MPVLWIGAEKFSSSFESELEAAGLELVRLPPGALVASSDEPTLECYGRGCDPAWVRARVGRDEGGPGRRASLVFGAAGGAAAYQELIDGDQLYFLASGPLAEEELLALLVSARKALLEPPGRRAALPAGNLRRLALASSLAELAAELETSAASLAAAQEARCWLLDRAQGGLVAPAEEREAAEVHSPAAGLVSFVLRTGQELRLDEVGGDPRFEAELDNPRGTPSDRFAAVPLPGPAGQAVGALAVFRPASKAPFSALEMASLETLAAAATPYLAAWIEVAAPSSAESSPFRPQALRELEAPLSPYQEPLRLAPGWTRWSFALVPALAVAALLALVLVRVPEYGSGPAIVRGGGRHEVTALSGGVVKSVAVAAGQRVEAGELLLTLDAAEAEARLARLGQELELRLAERLRAPGDEATTVGLASLAAEQKLARAELARRELRAPVAGTVSDLRARPGELLAEGQPVAAILEREAAPRLLLLLPGRYLPQLAPGMRVRLELEGYPYFYQWLPLEEVPQQATGPAEARRLLGPEAADSVELAGPVALVTARLPGASFEVAGRSLPYRDGLAGRAEVEVRSERLLFLLVPALRGLGGSHG
ncbi:MAG: HlyD family efflux transporter periplasmic adaptor subunit [Thermoanaerobaculia bacterium]